MRRNLITLAVLGLVLVVDCWANAPTGDEAAVKHLTELRHATGRLEMIPNEPGLYGIGQQYRVDAWFDNLGLQTDKREGYAQLRCQLVYYWVDGAAPVRQKMEDGEAVNPTGARAPRREPGR